MKVFRKIYFISIILLIFLTNLKAQTAAELGEKLKSASIEEKAYLLNQLAEISLPQSADKSINYADMALQAATQANNANEKITAYENLASAYEAQGNHKKSIPYFQSAANGYIQLKQYQTAGYVLSNLADANLAEGKFDEAINANKQAISQYNLTKDKKNASACLMNIGDVYLKQKNYQNAIDNYKVALKNFMEINDKEMQVHTLTRLGSAYSNWGNYELQRPLILYRLLALLAAVLLFPHQMPARKKIYSH